MYGLSLLSTKCAFAFLSINFEKYVHQRRIEFCKFESHLHHVFLSSGYNRW